MKRLTAAIILGLASLFLAVNPAVAQDDARVTASDVVDRESLKAFVLEAREYLDSFETLSGYRDALESFRAGGDWKQGSVYLLTGLLKHQAKLSGCFGNFKSSRDDFSGHCVTILGDQLNLL